MLSADKVIEIFCIADDFCNEYDVNIEKTLSVLMERSIADARDRCLTAR